MLFLNKR